MNNYDDEIKKRLNKLEEKINNYAKKSFELFCAIVCSLPTEQTENISKIMKGVDENFNSIVKEVIKKQGEQS